LAHAWHCPAAVQGNAVAWKLPDKS
jgi:hypothetical protein